MQVEHKCQERLGIDTMWQISVHRTIYNQKSSLKFKFLCFYTIKLEFLTFSSFELSRYLFINTIEIEVVLKKEELINKLRYLRALEDSIELRTSIN